MLEGLQTAGQGPPVGGCQLAVQRPVAVDPVAGDDVVRRLGDAGIVTEGREGGEGGGQVRVVGRVVGGDVDVGPEGLERPDVGLGAGVVLAQAVLVAGLLVAGAGEEGVLVLVVEALEVQDQLGNVGMRFVKKPATVGLGVEARGEVDAVGGENVPEEVARGECVRHVSDPPRSS